MSAALLQILQWFDNGGAPLAAGRISSFEAGTSTPKALYTDYTGTVAHPNPVILDAAGRVPNGGALWTVGAYKIRVADSQDTQIIEIDNLDLGGAPLGAQESSTLPVAVPAVPGQARLTASALFPADVEPLYVLGRVTTSFGTSNGLTGLTIGDPNEGDDYWCDSLGIVFGSVGTVGQTKTRVPRLINASARDVIVVAQGGPFDAIGEVELTGFFRTATI